MNPIIQKIWVFLSILWISIAASAYDFEADGIYYTVVSVPELTCEVSTSPKDQKYSGDIKIPAEVSYRGKTLKVVKIGKEAFRSCGSLISVTIPNSVAEIGGYAFQQCSSLISVEIPNSVTKIGRSAFMSCSDLASIEIPNSIKEIEELTFSYCTSLTSIKIPNSVTRIGKSAFDGCTSLTSVEIPNSVTEIGSGAFWSCSSLTSVDIPNSITIIDEFTFRACSSLTSVKIPNSITEIKSLAFLDCSSLKSIELPNSITEIGVSAFKRTSLTSITIPEKVKKIETLAFSECFQLDTIYFKKSNDILDIRTTRYSIFSETGENKTVILQRSIIYNSYMYDIVNLIVGDSVSVEKFPFKGNTLQNLVLGKDIIIRQEVEEGYLSPNFKAFSALQTLTLKDETPPFTIECTHEQYLNVKVRVPAGSLQAYQSADGWKNFWDIEEYGESSGIESAAVITVKTISGKYDIYGRPVDDNYVGLVIIQYSDGTTEKVINR